MLQKLEQGRVNASLHTVDKLARALGVTTASLLGKKPIARQDGEALIAQVLAQTAAPHAKVEVKQGLGNTAIVYEALRAGSRLTRDVRDTATDGRSGVLCERRRRRQRN